MYKILLADDDPAVREGMPVLIDWAAEGFEIAAVAENGRKALEIFNNQHFDLVITDVRMPDMSGLELVEIISQLPNPCKTVILSGFGEFRYAQEAMKHGVKRYLLKPVSEELLLQMLSELRGALRSEREPEAETIEKDLASPRLAQILEPVLSFVKDHCAEKLSLQKLAADFYINPAYLGRIFKRYTKLSFNSYLIECRIALAKQLLKKGMSVTQASGSVGYEDTDHFARLFKVKTGISPSEYKNNSLKKEKN